MSGFVAKFKVREGRLIMRPAVYVTNLDLHAYLKSPADGTFGTLRYICTVLLRMFGDLHFGDALF
jgi:hypothetical protein